MSFRTRLFLASVVVVLIPLGALAYGVRSEMERRLTTQYQERLRSLTSVIASDLEAEDRTVAARLRTLASELARNDRFRLAVIRGDPSSRRFLLDYAGESMRMAGLSLLQVQAADGRILSSGHFRNEFDRVQPELPRMLTTAGRLALVRTRTPDTTLLALSRVDSFQVSGRQFFLVGGSSAGTRLLDRLAPDGELSVTLALPPVLQADSGVRVLEELPLPFIDLLAQPPRADTARLLVTQSLGTLTALRESVDRWLVVALGLTLAAALIAAAWLSARISRPLRELAGKTAEIDLDRLNQSFESERSDEIGALSRLLGEMTQRLRLSSAKLREMERRAAVGDLARQVNHDIKNGLAPIRNVLRHLSQIGQEDPQRLASVFQDRRSTLESSVQYLENLARNYARLSPEVDRRPCDINGLISEVLRTTASDGTELRARLQERLPPVLADRLVLRRILENLIGNAIDSMSGREGGTVTVATETALPGRSDRVRITVSDTGAGMSREQLERAFDDFYTTKPGGTGLGLSIVRRLVMDLQGSLRIETEPGAGTRVIVELPSSDGSLSTPAA
jgi:signal transduction histidine kinase